MRDPFTIPSLLLRHVRRARGQGSGSTLRYGSRSHIDRPEEVTYLFDKPVHTKCYPNEGEIQRRLNSHTYIALRLITRAEQHLEVNC